MVARSASRCSWRRRGDGDGERELAASLLVDDDALRASISQILSEQDRAAAERFAQGVSKQQANDEARTAFASAVKSAVGVPNQVGANAEALSSSLRRAAPTPCTMKEAT